MRAAVRASWSCGRWLPGPPAITRVGAVISARPSQCRAAGALRCTATSRTTRQSYGVGPSGPTGTGRRGSAGKGSGPSSSTSRATAAGRSIATSEAGTVPIEWATITTCSCPSASIRPRTSSRMAS